ncbi:MAG: EF2563 family selenium-dependent molybdenum hydroxylase system protein [Treponema sp.]|jgi:xanthine dehydrogenase accessory factor|nr:EF2563 family selenium-dependent molybdenum hydroxylase system protein [Treponema sp.]
MPGQFSSQIIVVRGGGDLATGAVQKFFRAGFPVVILETPAPTAIRRSVALCEAVYDGLARVEDMICRMVSDTGGLEGCWRQGTIPLLIDPAGESIGQIRPSAVVDAIMAKRNLGTHKGMAPVTIALGPGFCAGEDVDMVIETMRGHDLGRLIFEGRAMANTGIPGEIGGKSGQRVIHAPESGTVAHKKQIGDVVEAGEVLFTVGAAEVRAPFTGLLRGLVREGAAVPKGMKIADMDPRTDVDWRTISDKARCLGGAALEAYLLKAVINLS